MISLNDGSADSGSQGDKKRGDDVDDAFAEKADRRYITQEEQAPQPRRSLQAARRSSSGRARQRHSVSSGEGLWLVQSQRQLQQREQSRRSLLSQGGSRRSLKGMLGTSTRKSLLDTSSGSGRSLDRSKGSLKVHKDEPVSVGKPPPPAAIQENDVNKPHPLPGNDGDELSFRAEERGDGDIEVSLDRKDNAAPTTVKKNDNDEVTPEREGGQPRAVGQAPEVSFSNCTVRYYPTMVGDNPSCSSGPALSLGWAYDPSATDTGIPIDAYEAVRAPRRRSEWDLVLSRAERERRLLDAGCNRDNIARGVQEIARVKNQRRRTVLNLALSGAEENLEGWSRGSRKALRLRRSSHCLYDDWIKSGGTAAAVPGVAAAEVVLAPAEGTHQPLRSRLAASLTRRRSEDEPSVVTSMDTKDPDGANPVVPAGPAFGISRLRMSIREELLLDGLDDGVDDDEGGNADVGGETPTTAPFAIVDLVFPKSPAAEAGLRRGDRIVKFGNVTCDNHRNLRAVTDVGAMAASKERDIPVTVLRVDGNTLDDEGGEEENSAATTVRLVIRPRAWSGVGLFGFLLKRC